MSLSLLGGCASTHQGQVLGRLPESAPVAPPAPVVQLTYDDIIAMHRAGRGSSDIIAEIRSTGSLFAPEKPELDRLRQAGVSSEVIEVMRSTTRAALTPPPRPVYGERGWRSPGWSVSPSIGVWGGRGGWYPYGGLSVGPGWRGYGWDPFWDPFRAPLISPGWGGWGHGGWLWHAPPRPYGHWKHGHRPYRGWR